MKRVYILTATLALGLIPSLRAAGIPVRFDWSDYFVTFWVSLSIQAAIAAVILWVMARPREFWNRLTNRPEDPAPLFDRSVLLRLLAPAAFLFCVFILVFAYNDAIAFARFDGRADALLDRADARLMAGWTSASLAAHVSPRIHLAIQLFYESLFAVIGGVLILLALSPATARGKRPMDEAPASEVMRFVGTIAAAYYVSLAVFFFLPAYGPCYATGSGDRHLNVLLAQLVAHHAPRSIGLDYFIAIPSMHIAQPLIAAWFTRRWRRLSIFLFGYAAALVPVVVLLEQHYVVDALAGAALAPLAIWIVAPGELKMYQFRENGESGSRRAYAAAIGAGQVGRTGPG